MKSRREVLLSAAFALWGLSFAISLYSYWNRPAPAGQLPGLGTRLGYDAHGPFGWVAGLILLPLVFVVVLRPVARRLADARPWARNTALIAPLVALWSVTIQRTPLWVLVPYAAVMLVCLALRNRELAFTRRDAVLLPTLLTMLLAVHDLRPTLSIDRAFILAALLVFALRVAVALIPSTVPPALAFTLAPLALILQTGFFARDQRYNGWPALAIVIVTPFVLRFVIRDPRLAIRALVLVVYPLSLYAYVNATSIQTAEGKPRVNVFEDSHSLLPASEYLSGELPYRDILPAHGLIEDGYFDFLVMRVREANIGTLWKSRLAVGSLNTIALYALAIAITGSAEASLFAVLLTLMTGWFTPSLRVLPALVTLALIAGAVRYRRLRWLRYAALGCVVCGLTSLDFAAYTFLTLIVAVLRFGEQRRRAALAVLAGLALGAIPLFLGFAFLGIFDDFLRGTFVEVLSVGPVYAMNLFTHPPALEAVRTFPEVLGLLFDRTVFPYLFWCAIVVFVAAAIARSPRRRFEPFVLVGVWIVLTAVSYAERHHLYFTVVAPTVLIGATCLLIRRRSALVPIAIVALIILASPTTHLGVVGWVRDLRGPADAQWVELPEIPRARRALFLNVDAQAILGVQKYLSLALGPDETFLDFSNRGILYFLFRRDCPIRWYEVAFYETEERQREVIRALERDPRVKAVLVTGPFGRYTVDGVRNEDRAPLVWQYIETHFTPDFEEGDVVFWRRK